jgi:predicted enzyme related to lactoylglutathione lyase
MADPCPIEWILIPAPRLDETKRFYEEVFGFRFSEYSPTFHPFKAANISGALDGDLTPSAAGMSFSVTVPALDAAVGRARAHGATVRKEPYSLGPGAGFCAAILDPSGNGIEIYSAVR